MGFSFRLQVLLNWKESQEELSRIRLAERLEDLKRQEEKIRQLKAQRLLLEQELEAKLQAGISADEYVIYKHFADESYWNLLRAEDQKVLILQEVDREREALLKLLKEKKILEKLKEKKRKRFVYEMEKKEQKEIDERATMRYRVPSP